MMGMLKEGWPFVLGACIVGVLFTTISVASRSMVFASLAGLAFVFMAFCAYFFRDPARTIPQDSLNILSAADGRILEAVQTTDPISGQPAWVVRIFLSVFNAHLQRSPLSGRVETIRYQEGKFLDARHPKAPFENEQNQIAIVSPEHHVTVVQIAGLIARRIICWVKEGESVEIGQKIGLIKFGSQVDVFFPLTFQPAVKTGDVVQAGESVLATAVASKTEASRPENKKSSKSGSDLKLRA